MALKAGRVGVARSEVDTNGKIKGGSSSTYTKDEIDTKLSLKEDASKIGNFEFRTEEGVAQYRTSPEGEWVNFSSGGGVGVNLDNPITSGLNFYKCTLKEGGYQIVDNICFVNMTVIFTESTYANTVIVDGLPRPVVACQIPTQTTISGNKCRLDIDTGGYGKWQNTLVNRDVEVKFEGAYRI